MALMIMNNHRTFNEIYPTLEDFTYDYNNCGIPATLRNEESIGTIYYLLLAQYGQWQIASNSSKVFALKLFQVIFQYGSVWEKKLDLQNKLIDLSEDELLKGSKTIYNVAQNPGTEPSTDTLEELTAISNQSTTNYKRAKIEGYSKLYYLLKDNITNKFLNKFNYLFSKWNLDSDAVYIDRESEEE